MVRAPDPSGRTMDLSLERRASTPAHVHTRRLDDELVILNLENECYFGLDEVGTRIWEVISTSSTIRAGLDQLLAEFEVDAAQLEVDVKALLAQLVDNGLVELHDA